MEASVREKNKIIDMSCLGKFKIKDGNSGLLEYPEYAMILDKNDDFFTCGLGWVFRRDTLTLFLDDTVCLEPVEGYLMHLDGHPEGYLRDYLRKEFLKGNFNCKLPIYFN